MWSEIYISFIIISFCTLSYQQPDSFEMEREGKRSAQIHWQDKQNMRM